ncbi:uncharacterized protein LOC132619156 [Lycium barbarum]|uniref:uncharacterized protein LOC132619156 n=1 Tax=Lycium barbarum TaxID=112863 RepID=UPI00293F75A0|nr:uncharacterized protein LOC132619156 [Lycium barbarum]XP_060190095.1 uncharacterized protein LOC132619156 [Lycium barbarum]XP_060190096.1 uncharacterized protein LOC132619156 [Lycium barbarum]
MGFALNCSLLSVLAVVGSLRAVKSSFPEALLSAGIELLVLTSSRSFFSWSGLVCQFLLRYLCFFGDPTDEISNGCGRMIFLDHMVGKKMVDLEISKFGTLVTVCIEKGSSPILSGTSNDLLGGMGFAIFALDCSFLCACSHRVLPSSSSFMEQPYLLVC